MCCCIERNSGRVTRCVRTTLFLICGLQLMSCIERQIFDFLGYLWTPMLLNFVQLLIIIVGVFGCQMYRKSLCTAYLCWNVFWFGWNLFLIFLFLEVGSLNSSTAKTVLAWGTDSTSWWKENGVHCHQLLTSTPKPKRSFDAIDDNSTAVVYLTPESVVVPVSALPQDPFSEASSEYPMALSLPLQGPQFPNEPGPACLLHYRYIEALHAGIQAFLCMLAIPLMAAVMADITEEEDAFYFFPSNTWNVKFHPPPRPASPVRSGENRRFLSSPHYTVRYANEDPEGVRSSTASSGSSCLQRETMDHRGSYRLVNQSMDPHQCPTLQMM